MEQRNIYKRTRPWISIMLKNLKIGTKFTLLIGFFLLNIVGLIFITTMVMGRIAKELDQIVQKDIPLTKLATAITEHQLEQAIEYERGLRYGESGRTARFRTAEKHFEELDEKIEKEIEQGQAMVADILDTVDDPDLRKEVEVVERTSNYSRSTTRNTPNTCGRSSPPCARAMMPESANWKARSRKKRKFSRKR